MEIDFVCARVCVRAHVHVWVCSWELAIGTAGCLPPLHSPALSRSLSGLWRGRYLSSASALLCPRSERRKASVLHTCCSVCSNILQALRPKTRRMWSFPSSTESMCCNLWCSVVIYIYVRIYQSSSAILYSKPVSYTANSRLLIDFVATIIAPDYIIYQFNEKISVINRTAACWVHLELLPSSSRSWQLNHD